MLPSTWNRWYILPLLIAVISLLFIGLLFVQQPALAQTPQSPTPTPVAVTQPADLALTVAAQQAQINILEERVKELKADLDRATADTRSLLDQKLIVAAILTGLLAVLGYQTYHGLDEQIRQKVSATLDKELYQMDPTLLTIYLPEQLKRELKRLRLSGLKNIKLYTDFNAKASRRGITVVSIVKANAQDTRDEDRFVDFIHDNNFDPTQAAFILYAPPGTIVGPRAMTAYDNLGLANTPTTLAGAVLVVARGLKTVYTPSDQTVA
jgi:hypothetical protein